MRRGEYLTPCEKLSAYVIARTNYKLNIVIIQGTRTWFFKGNMLIIMAIDHHWSFELESRSCRGVLDSTLCDKVCHWLAASRWFSPGTFAFLHQYNWSPRYNLNIVESGARPHKFKLYTDVHKEFHISIWSCRLTVTRQKPLVELTFLELIVISNGLRVAQSIFCIVFCWLLLAFSSYTFWPLKCLPFFDLGLLITSLAS